VKPLEAAAAAASMSATVSKTTKTYTYRSSGGGNADVSIEYSADMSALTRLEVSHTSNAFFLPVCSFYTDKTLLWSTIMLRLHDVLVCFLKN
jgi:hypothetical protein